MKTIQLENRISNVITDLSELSISRFIKYDALKKITYSNFIEQEIDRIICLSDMTIDEVEGLDISILNDLVIDINKLEFQSSTEYIKQIEINGIIYSCRDFDIDYEFKVKQIKYLNQSIKINPDDYVLDLASIIFIEDGGDLSQESILKRKMVFGEGIMMNVMSPFLIKLGKYVVDELSNKNLV